MKYLFLLTFIGLIITESKLSKKDATKRKRILKTAQSNLGAKYSTTNKDGFDCSGFVQHCYAAADIKIPRSSKKQYIIGQVIEDKNCTSGDIIAFTGTNHQSTHAGHVGIVSHIKSDTIYFIHASSSRGVVIDHNYSPYYQKRYLGVLNMSSF